LSLLANSNAIETGGYQISRSVRLRSSASAYLNRTPASAGNRKTWTWSAWVKIGKALSTGLFTASTSASDMYTIQLGSGGEIAVYAYSSSAYQYFRNTSAVFRDYSAWYHFVVAFDSTQATDTNRIKIYVNGVLQSTTSGSGSGWPSLNYDGGVNNTIKHQLSENVGGAQYFDGYLTEINFIDGQALTPSSFGQTDTITGSWVAKKYTGTYGTNGFYLNFSDNSAATSTTIGKDYSGNGNNWTPNNISVTAGSTYDSMLDVPSGNGYADGGNGRGNYSTLNPLFVNNTYPITYSNGNLNATRASGGQGGITNTFGMSSGKWYWEVVFSTFTYNIGITTNPAGSTTGSEGLAGYNGGGGTSIGFQPSGVLRTNGTAGSTYTSWTTGDVMAIALDMDGGNLYFYKNGTAINSGSPVATSLTGSTWFFITSVESGASLVVNFGQRPFSYTPPTGFKALNTTNLSDPTVKKGSSYFNPVLYTGNGSTQSISTVGFQPDFIWIKGRNAARFHILEDAIRGATKDLYSNSTNAEATNANSITAFNSNGFSIGSDSDVNTNTESFVAWNWKANGTGVSNTAGTITSTVSANTTSGFSIVTYTGTGANATVGHGLGVAPSMVIVKSRSVAGRGWIVWHSSLAATEALELSVTDAKITSTTSWNSTAPSSTVISLGTRLGTNESGTTFVCYAFATVPGYSAFGKYTGNGSADGPFVYCGFRPRYVFTKRTDTTGDWWVRDTARSPYNEAVQTLYLNSSAAEVGSGFDLLSNGFKPRTTDPTLNASGGTYIYAAFAENPLKFSNAR